MEFSEEKGSLWSVILSAVLSSSSQEARVFQTNLEELKRQNFEETGFDPNKDGPPEHIANQIVKIMAQEDDGQVYVKPKKDPHYWKNTFSIVKKQSNV